MAVYERSYKRYEGALTPQWSRFLVLPRYAYEEVVRSKLFIIFFILCLIHPAIQAIRIYLYHRGSKIFEALPGSAEFFRQFLSVDAEFFGLVMAFQSTFAFFMALFIGPGLVSKDLANNGLPLYLSRPISRAEYVLGKFSVLGILLSLITWVPGLLLYGLQSLYAGWGWAFSNLRFAASILVGSAVWIGTISLLALAVSAWVKWRPIAGFMMFMIFLGGSFVGLVVNALFRTDWGHMANLGVVIARIWESLLGLPASDDLPAWAAWVSISIFCLLCIQLLNKKIRSYEVVS
ncbi:MAG: ABC transporter permease subunit [Acidobacteriota bacterium]